MKGYSMKASPFKQVNDKPVKATEVGVNVLKTTTTPDTTKEVETETTTEGGLTGKKEKQMSNEAWTAHLAKETPAGKAKRTQAEIDRGIRKPDVVTKTKKKEVVKGKTSSSNNYTSTQTRDKGDAQTSLDRRNTVRSGKHTARTKKAAQRKIDRIDRKTGKTTKTRKEQRLARNKTQAEDNLAVSTGENDNAKRQSKQNISPKGNKDVKGKTRNSELSDFTVDKQEAKIKAGDVNAPKRKRAKASGIKGVGVKNVGSTESKAPKISKTKPRTTRSTSGAENLMVDPQNKDTKLAKRRTK
jgi:hypothetical protein